MAKNIEKYLNASSDQFSPYGNGIVYKNDDAFKAENDDICYISEYALEDLEDWECSQIIESEILDNVDYYWTEWDECGEDPRIYEK